MCLLSQYLLPSNMFFIMFPDFSWAAGLCCHLVCLSTALPRSLSFCFVLIPFYHSLLDVIFLFLTIILIFSVKHFVQNHTEEGRTLLEQRFVTDAHPTSTRSHIQVSGKKVRTVLRGSHPPLMALSVKTSHNIWLETEAKSYKVKKLNNNPERTKKKKKNLHHIWHIGSLINRLVAIFSPWSYIIQQHRHQWHLTYMVNNKYFNLIL